MEFEKNADGTDKLDEQGNPIPVTVIDDKDKELAQINAQLVDEIKELRTKNSMVTALLEKRDEKPIDPNKQLTDDEKLDLLLEKKLKEKEAQNAIANKKAAFEKFITEHKEFHPENDALGFKRAALEKKVNQFNTDGLSTQEEFLTVIGDAKTLLMGNDSPTETSKGNAPYSNTPTPRGTPPAKQPDELSPKELKLAEMTGKTKEQILKLKLKNPEYLDSLLDYVK